MNEQQLQEWLDERRKEISDAPLSPVFVLTHVIVRLIERLDAIENLVATPPDEAEEAE